MEMKGAELKFIAPLNFKWVLVAEWWKLIGKGWGINESGDVLQDF